MECMVRMGVKVWASHLAFAVSSDVTIDRMIILAKAVVLILLGRWLDLEWRATVAEIQTCESSTDYGLTIFANCKSIELRICQA